MNLLLYWDAMAFFESSDKGSQRILKEVTQNAKVRYLYSSRLLKFFTDSFSFSTDATQQLVQHIMDRGVPVATSGTSKTFEEEFQEIGRLASGWFLGVCADAVNRPIEGWSFKVATTTAVLEPNFDWLAFEIVRASPNKVTRSHFHFKANSEVEVFFKNCFRLANPFVSVSIFDPYCSFNHSLFDGAVPSGVIWSIYTTEKSLFLPKDGPAAKDKLKRVKGKIGNLEIWIKKPNKEVHGRRVILGDFILSSDEDFSNLVVNRSDWSVDFQVCPIVAKNWMKNVSHYYVIK